MSATAPVRHAAEPRSEGLHRASGRSGLGIALTLTTVALWSVLPIGLKIALAGMDAFTITWYRFLCAALILAAILARNGTLPRLGALDGRAWTLLAVATVFLCANYVLYVLGLERTNAGTAQVVIQLAPLLLGVGGVWIYGERVGLPQWLGLATMTIGLVLFSHEQIVHLVGGQRRYWVGLLCIVVAALAWAVYGLAQKQLLNRLSSPAILVMLYAGGALLFAPLAAPARLASLTGTELAALAFCIANMLIAYGTFAEALVHLEASRVSALLAIAPLTTLVALHVTNVLLPGIVAPEPITGVAVAGAALVVAGSLTAALGRRVDVAVAVATD